MAFGFKQTISFLYVIIVLASTASSLLRHDEECLALFQFKQAILQPYTSFDDGRFDSWRKITSNASHHHDSNYDCCFWYGVVCSDEGHVIRLDLSQSSLHGPIKSNSTLFNLVHLRMLNLSMNNFVESQIPSEIGRLKQLRILDLSDSGFRGQIPSEISQLVQLSLLDLSWNSLKVRSPSLEYLLQNMTRLEELRLSWVDVSSSVPHCLANFSSLRLINLDNCQLQDEFPLAIFQLPKLKYLNMRNNTNLTGFLPEFHNSNLLVYLNLNATGFGGTIPDSIGKLNHLVSLVLSNCFFSGHIPGSLSNMTQLTELGLGKNELTGLIPSSVMNLTTLTDLDLSLNNLQGPISSGFSNFKSLVFLHLGFNKFNGTVDLDTFVGLHKLRWLALSGNRISLLATNNYTNNTLPELEVLALASCNLTEFPAFLSPQNKMILLKLHDNKIEGLVPKWIWNNSQETLQVIDLQGNLITGFHQNPRNLSWLYLEYINFSDNQLQGWLPIPPRTTSIYDVSNNDLTREISPLICEVKSLQYFNLSFNNMMGTIPPCLGNLNSLTVLNLDRNNFHGPMINTFTHGSPLKEIDLSENQLTGQVSKSLANCTNLEVLSLGDNFFHGFFPFWLGNLAELEVLILRSNKFYGEIQGLSSISSQFPKLRILDLSNNSFIGQLPDTSFRNWKAMKSTYTGELSAMGTEIGTTSYFPGKYIFSMTLINKGVKRKFEKILNIVIAIDMSCNNFVGEIPSSLLDLQGLQSLNLSNNHLTGRILPSLGNLKNIESLDFSQNELSGEIPQELLQLGFLEIFNVSFNHLEGHIPQGRQFNTFDNSSYVGNHGLCGQPLSKNCRRSKTPIPPPTRHQYESFLPRERIEWIIISLGVGSGLTIGVVLGSILYERYSDLFVERFGLRNERRVRTLSNM